MKKPELILIACLFVVQSTTANVITKGVREITEAILKKSGKEATQEIVEFGGKQAIQEVLEKAAKEGGDELVEKVIWYARKYGLSALETIGNDPSLYVKALDDLPEKLVERALWAAQREQATMRQLLTQHGSDALLIAAKHRGVGTDIAAKLGDDGIRIARNLNENQAVVLARHADDIAGLPSPQKRQVVDAILSAPERVIDYMENHPKVFMTAAGITTLAALKNEAMGKTVEVAPNPDGRSGSNQNTEPADQMPGPSGKLIPSILIIIAFIVIGVVVGKMRGIHQQEKIKASRINSNVNQEKKENLLEKGQPTEKPPKAAPCTKQQKQAQISTNRLEENSPTVAKSRKELSSKVTLHPADASEVLDVVLAPSPLNTEKEMTLRSDENSTPVVSESASHVYGSQNETDYFVDKGTTDLVDRCMVSCNMKSLGKDEAKLMAFYKKFDAHIEKHTEASDTKIIKAIHEGDEEMTDGQIRYRISYLEKRSAREHFFRSYKATRADDRNEKCHPQETAERVKALCKKKTLQNHITDFERLLCLGAHYAAFFKLVDDLRSTNSKLNRLQACRNIQSDKSSQFPFHHSVYHYHYVQRCDNKYSWEAELA